MKLGTFSRSVQFIWAAVKAVKWTLGQIKQAEWKRSKREASVPFQADCGAVCLWCESKWSKQEFMMVDQWFYHDLKKSTTNKSKCWSWNVFRKWSYHWSVESMYRWLKSFGNHGHISTVLMNRWNISTTIGWIVMKCCSHIHFPLRNNCSKFADPLTFHLEPWSGTFVQNFALGANKCRNSDIPISLSSTLCLVVLSKSDNKHYSF